MYKEKKPVCTIVIIVINVLVFLVLSFIGITEDATFMLNHGAMYVPFVQENQEYYRMFTSLFLHFGVNHLMNNMIMLAVMGSRLEQEIGKWKYLVIYFAAGIGGNLCSMKYDVITSNYAVSAGASGAIFGVVGALLYVVLRNRGRLGTLTGKGILFMIGLSLYYGFTSSGVDNLAHIGGLITGFFCSALLYWKPNRKGRSDT